jgi:hypothetical protein
MSLKRDVDQQRLDQIAPRRPARGPSATIKQRRRILRMQLVEAGRWAGRNNGQQPFVIQAPPPPSAGPPRTAARTFPTDGGQAPDQRLVTVANDIGERSIADQQARQQHQVHQQETARPQESVRPVPTVGEKAMDQAALHVPHAEATPERSREDFTRAYTGPRPPKPTGPRPKGPRPKR